MLLNKNNLSLVLVGLTLCIVSVCSKLSEKVPVKPQDNQAQLHQTGWLDTLATGFHGKYIREHAWNLEECRKCHGDNYDGGTSGTSCNLTQCHPNTPESCTTCHGGRENLSGAPPKDIDNHVLRSFKGVGAHTAHVANLRWAKPLSCSECHVKPGKLNDTGHLDSNLPAEIVWGEFSRKDNLSPVWVDTTCSNVYCHGASLKDGILTRPVWTQSEPLTCNACHGIAPTSGAHEKHVQTQKMDCNTCHDGYQKNEVVNLDTHIDGRKDVRLSQAVGGTYANGACSNVTCHGSGNSPLWTEDAELACTSCHGGIDNNSGAPPKDLQGNTSKTVKGVGAHTAHVSAAKFGRPYDCTECHMKPMNINDPGHVDSNPPVEIVWGELAKSDGITPAWNGTTCSDIYCHGASLPSGVKANQVWTQTGSLSCNSCHALSPGSGAHEKHIETYQLDCNICHDGYSNNKNINQTLHIDGRRDVLLNVSVGGTYSNGVCSNVRCHGSGDSPDWNASTALNCTGCHGGVENSTGAPPLDLSGNSLAGFRGVGAHTAHVGNPRWGRAYDCGECHQKPMQVSDAGHIDLDPSAEIVWGEFSRTGNLSPVWDGSNCRNVYCHGASLANGTLSTPDWTRAQALSCNACHGSPPNTGAHDEHTRDYQIDCQVCHEGYSKDTAVNPLVHINGARDVRLTAAVGGTYANGVCSNVSCHGSGDTPAWSVDVTLNCTSCHGGTDNLTGAPPVDLLGNSSMSMRGIGAHTLHVETQPWARAFDCQECHSKPAKISDAGHIDLNRPAEIMWGTLSKTDGLAPSWNGNSCSNVYCHGASLNGGSSSAGKWAQAEAVNCASCHGLPPDMGAHEEHDQFGCQICHNGYVKDTAANPSIHINGQGDVQMDASVGGAYANGVCSNVLCHGRGDTPPWTGEGDLECTSCHGGADNESGAPPYDLLGNTLTTMKGVGAHTAHVIGGAFSDGMECSECHLKPDETDAPGHIGIELLPAEIVWGLLAKEDNAIPLWDGTEKCENVYCHGESRYGNKENNPSWIVVDGSQAACGSCHALPPARPHPTDTQCSTCHAKVIDASNNIIDKEKHINGQTDLFISK